MTEIEPCPKCGALPCDWTDNPHTAPSGDEKEDEAVDDWNQRAERPSPAASEVERAVMVCPQCEGEGGYPDGMDEAACHTECTRCGSNGWIVNQAAIAAMRPVVEVEEARDILSALSSYLGAGLGDDATTLAQFDDRIRWGIDHIGRVYRSRAAQVVEECSKRPGTTWGAVKRAILDDTCLPTAQPAALRQAGEG